MKIFEIFKGKPIEVITPTSTIDWWRHVVLPTCDKHGNVYMLGIIDSPIFAIPTVFSDDSFEQQEINMGIRK
jgi:hypothetical protein